MPTVSPGRSAGGLMREAFVCEGIVLPILNVNATQILNEKLAAANQFRRPTKKNLALPADCLHSARSMDPYRRLGALAGNGSYRRGTGTGPGRLGLADSALEKSDFDITRILDDHQLDVDPLLEAGLTPDFRSLGLPFRSELFYKDNVVRVPHGDWDAAHFTK